MRQFLAVVIFLVFCALIFSPWLISGGVPVTGLLVATLPGPDTASLDARQATAEALSTQSAGEALFLRSAQQQTRQAYADQLAQQTAQVQAETAAVLQQQTAAAWQVTVDAARLQDTATAQAITTQQVATQAALRVTQTADIIKLQGLAGQATQIARDNENQAARAAIDLQVKSSTRYWWVIAAAFAVGAGGFFGYRFLRIREDTAAVPVPVDPATGRAAPMVMRGQVVSMDLSRVPVQDPRKPIQAVDADQLEIVHRDQTVRAIYGTNRIGARQPVPRGPVPASFPIEQAPPEDMPAVAPWDLTGWTGATLPLGIGPGRTAISLNPQKTPNLLVAGTSDSGKTMKAMRPILAEALASGWQALLLNEKGGDFTPLKSHANLVVIDGRAAEVADALEAVVGEVNRRDQILKSAGVSTYYRLGNAGEVIGPRVLVMIDELVSLINGAPSQRLSERIWAAAVDITSRCRSMGLMMVIATTDPTYRTLGKRGLSMRDNCGRMIFRVRDLSVSMAALDARGAESLTGCQFIAQLDAGAVHGVAFQPEDGDIVNFLAARQVEQLPAPKFLTDGAGEPSVVVDSRDQRIRDLAGQGKSLNEIQREVFGFTGGAAYSAVKAVVDASTTTTESTSTTTPAPAV